MWVFTDFFILLVAFWTQTLITQQLIGTARTLEADWWQVCGEAWVWGQRKISTGCVSAVGFHHVRPILAHGTHFETYEPFISLIFQIYFRPRSTVDTGPDCILNSHEGRSYLKFAWYNMILCTCCRGCDNCEEWYHGDCIRITERESKYIKQFFCVVQDFHLTLHKLKFKKVPWINF